MNPTRLSMSWCIVAIHVEVSNLWSMACLCTRYSSLGPALAGTPPHRSGTTDCLRQGPGCVRVGARLTAIQSRLAEIERPLRELQISKEKLTSSRRVAEERENLSRTMLGLAGTAEGVGTVTLDAGLQADLKAAREAVVMAEALLEAKGD